MTASIILGIGLEYVDTIFQTIKNSDFSQYTIAGMKTLAVLFFLVNILKKYNEGVADKHGYTWGLSPGELAKNFAVVLVVIFSTQVLGFFDAILVAIEGQYRGTAPALLPLQMQDIPIEEEVGFVKAAQAAMALLYEALVTPLFGFKIIRVHRKHHSVDIGSVHLPLVSCGAFFPLGHHAGVLSFGHQSGRF